MTTLTNAAILLAAREVEVTCGGCRMTASPARVLGIVARTVEERATHSPEAVARAMVDAAAAGVDLNKTFRAYAEATLVRRVFGLVEYRCRTPDCEIGVGPGVACEVPL